MLEGSTHRVSAGSVVELIRRTAAARPSAIAIEFRGSSSTLGDFWSRSMSIAQHLRIAGIAPGDRVAIWGERTPDTIAAALAVMAIRAAYVPIEPTHPRGRVELILETADTRALLYDDLFTNLSPPTGRSERIALSAIPRVPHWHPPELPIGQDIAYVIFTSGSTGIPKGVAIEHGSLVNYCCWCAAVVGNRPGGSPVFTSLGFDLSITSIWPALICGGPLILLSGAWDLENLFKDRPERYRFLKATPSHIRFFEKARRPLYRGITCVLMFGGEPLDAVLIRALDTRLDGVRLINHYGPTEATVGCCFYEFDNRRLPVWPTVPIGGPIWNTRAYVVDDNLDPCRPGEEGELIVAGLGVAHGYIGNGPSESFIDEHDVGARHGRAYRTGDIVKEVAHNTLLYLGRLDGQLKVSGHRIELEELRRHAMHVDGVADAAFHVIRGDIDSVEAFVVAHNDGRSPAELVKAVRLAFARALPPAVVPRRVHVVPELLFDANGKWDMEATRRHARI